MMGMDVHDMENLGEQYVGYKGEPKSTQFGLKSLRLARELEPGYVVTIEPGIYFIPELIDMWKSENKFSDFINYDKVETYKDFGGLRNEEDFVITESGARLLGKPIPKSIEEVEAIREVFGAHCPPISATKSLTGHSLGAAGAQEAIYSILMMNNGFICESANIEKLDPAFEDVPIVRKRQDNVKLGCVLSNSFGFGGTNASLVLKHVDA